MARVQAVALDLFEQRGFDGVPIEEIARAAEVGPATIYRNFGDKERIVLWDEYDPMLLEALARELELHPVLEAVPRALATSLARVYRDDRERILRRARLMRSTPALQLKGAADIQALRTAVAAVLLASGRARRARGAGVRGGRGGGDGGGHPSLARRRGARGAVALLHPLVRAPASARGGVMVHGLT